MNKLGFFDSGLGGYSILRAVHEAFPSLDCVLFADQKHSPYGNKSPQEIQSYLRFALSWFKEAGIFDVVIACNTASSIALEEVAPEFDDMRLWGIVKISAEQFKNKKQHILVCATQATIKSHAYRDALPGFQVTELALHDLASYIERLQDKDVIDAYLKERLPKADLLLLACTHYPLAYESFRANFKGEIYDSIQPVLDLLKREYPEMGGSSSLRIVTSASADVMKKQLETLFGDFLDVEEI